MKTQPQFSQGAQVRYTDNEPDNPLRPGIVEGLVVDVQDTSGGNFRYRIRTDKPAPQGDGNIEVIVYSHQGTLERRFGVYEMVAHTYYDWRGHESRDYVPTARQEPIIAAVRHALNEAAMYYTADVRKHCVGLLQPTAEQLAVNSGKVEGGEFGMDLYYARAYLEAQRKFQWNDAMMSRIQQLVGTRVGTLIVNGVKLSSCFFVEITKDGVFQLEGNKGSKRVEISVLSANQFVSAFDQAAKRGYRKTDFLAFTA